MTGERKPIPFAQTPFNEFEARLSPDGKWLAYVSDESGRREVYVDRFPGGGQRSLISNAGGRAPRWHPNGREFFFVSAQQKLMALEVKSGDKFGVGTERALFQLQSRDNQFEVSRDGQRFLVNTVAGVQAQPLTVSTGWVTNLKR
jgi:Tol biopolymer transport system component